MQPEPQAPVGVVLRVTNRRSSDVAFGFEPWGDQFPLPTGATCEIAAEGPPGDGFEVALGDDYVEVWAWWGSVARVTSNGVEIARSAFRVPPQPGPPPDGS